MYGALVHYTTLAVTAQVVEWTWATYIHADVLSDVRSNPSLALVCLSAGYLSTLKELKFYPEKGVPTLGTPERGKASGIFFSIYLEKILDKVVYY